MPRAGPELVGEDGERGRIQATEGGESEATSRVSGFNAWEEGAAPGPGEWTEEEEQV